MLLLRLHYAATSTTLYVERNCCYCCGYYHATTTLELTN